MADTVKTIDLFGRVGLIEISCRFVEDLADIHFFESDLKLPALLFGAFALSIALKEAAASGGLSKTVLDLWSNLIALLVSLLKLLDGLVSTLAFRLERRAMMLRKRVELERLRLELLIAEHLDSSD